VVALNYTKISVLKKEVLIMDNDTISLDKVLAALAGLLISKGLITSEEWNKAIDLIPELNNQK
jgi:hypothetical protein